MNRKNIEDLYPLSPLQQGMLFHALYSPGTGAYLEQMAMTLAGPVQPETFRRAWQRVVDRHPVLRTGFVWEGVPQPLQVVYREFELPWEFEDWRGLPPEERARRFDAAMEAERTREMELTRPQVRVRLYRMAEGEHRFVLTTHHLLLDGWSMPVIFAEFGEVYGALVRGEEPRLPARRPFREYIAWLNRQDPAANEAFWRARLAGFPAPTPLPLDRAPARAGFPAERHAQARGDFPAELVPALEQAARSLRVTPSVMVQCAWAAVLAAYAGEREVVFGATVSGRPPELPGVEEMVGMFINTVPVRIRIPRGVPVAEWVQAAHREQAEARLYEHAQLAQVRTWSEVPPEGPLLETLLVYENYPLDALDDSAHFDVENEGEDAGFRVTEGSSPERTNYPLSLVAAPSPGLFRLTATYDAERLDAASVHALLAGLGRVLRQMIDDPAAPAEALTPLGPDEQRRAVRILDGETIDVPADATVARMFAAVAARMPDAVAVEHGDERITYAELDARSNRLARRLRALGVGPEVSVGVCLGRTLELVVALLAVHKAGGAHVPLDPAYPADRLGWMVENSAAPVVIADARTVGALPPTAARVLRIDAEADAIAAESADPFDVFAAPESLAWTLYTSGSTGRPKGVQLEQRGAITLLHWMRRWVPEEELRGVLFASTISFDASIAELFFALCWGGRAVLVENALSLAELGDDAGVVRAAMVPGAAAELARMGRIPSTVRTFALFGEALPPATVEDVYALGHVSRIENLYGPTEDTTFSCAWLAPRGAERVLIGRPIANSRGYVLDDALRPVPPGARGEVWMAGDGVSRGYRGRPGTTAERYLPDPFGPPGSRMYRTGDVARLTPSGELDYLGRSDFQVKVRGFRIELGEIESTLLDHPSVDEAVAVAVRDGAGHRLAAYVAPASADAAELRAHLAAHLPGYMVPPAIVALDALPRTPNGKVDRARLPDPGAPEAGAYVAPRTLAEEALAEIWAEVLKTERVGAHDSFFALGGHSLLATQVVSRVRAALGIDLPLRALFEHPTLEALAARVEDLLIADLEGMDDGEGAASADAGPVTPAGDGDLPLSLQQERLWFIDRMAPGSSAYNVAIGTHLAGALDVDALGRALAEIVRRHQALRTVLPETEGRPVQRVLPADGFALEMEDVSAGGPAAAWETAVRRMEEEGERPIDLARGPLFRARLLRLAEDEHVLLLLMHHVVSDAWSLGVLLRELSALYGAFRRGLPSPLDPLPLQYADYAAWQRSAPVAAATEAQVAWWRAHLEGAPRVLDLPTDRRRPPAQALRGGQHTFELDAALVGRVGALAAAEGATPFMVLLAAYYLLLARWAGTDDVLVGSPVAGRTRQETEGVIGFFANTLVLRGRVGPGRSFRELLAAVREDVLDAFAHQDVPFERLVDALRVERDLARTPLYQAIFTLQNATGGGMVPLDGLTVNGVAVPFRAIKTDLSLALEESGDVLRGSLEYAADLFLPATVERFAAHYVALLDAALADPARAVGDLSLPTPAERAELEARARPAAAFPADAPLHVRFAAQAARAPDAIALTFEGESLTYAKLDARANRLAHHLAALGAGPGALVGLCVERSIETVEGIIAILKTGAAYLPLDPAYPDERIAHMLDDSGARLVLATRDLASRVSGDGIRAVLLDAERDDIAARPATAPGVTVDPESAAYVIYTSGSTGRPKGVVVTHANVVRLFAATDEAFGFAADDVWTLFHSYAFDFSVWEMWGALLHGGRLVVVPARVAPDAEAFHALLARERVTMLSQTPSAFRALLRVDEETPRALALRCVVFGGEALDPASLRGWIDRHGDARPRLVNMYGITETTVHVTYRQIRREDVLEGSASPIGIPIPDLAVQVLDARAMVPVGVAGEMYVGGAGVAQGYLGRPALTAERFVPDPFGDGARRYRSGDRARWLADGGLEFLGRADRQVKVRGFRIEPGEVEAALLAHAAVRACVVDVRDGAAAGPRLVAWLVPADGASVDAASLREHLGRTLPEYMVPAAFVAVDAIPLTWDPLESTCRHASLSIL